MTQVREFIEQEIQRQIEHDQWHQDSGDAYAHLAGEGSWDYYNCDDKLVEYLQLKHGLTKDNAMEFVENHVDQVISCLEMVPHPSSIWSYQSDNAFVACQYPMTETLVHFEACMIEDQPFTWEELLTELKQDITFTPTCDYSAFIVEAMDASWVAVLTDKTISELLEEAND